MFPNGTHDEAGNDVINAVLDRLRTYGLNGRRFTPRKRQYVATFAGTYARKSAGFALIGTEAGHAWLKARQLAFESKHHLPKSKDQFLDPMSWEAISEFCAPLMVVTLEHLIYALTELDFLFDPLYESDVLSVLANKILKSRDGIRLDVPLRVLATDVEGSEDLFADMGIRPFAPLLPAPPAAAAPAAEQSREDAPVPVPAPGRRVAPPPPPPGTFVMGTGAQLVADYRYVTARFKNWKAFMQVCLVPFTMGGGAHTPHPW